MTDLTASPLCTDNFNSVIDKTDDGISLRLKGTADLHVFRSLGTLLGDVHEDAMRQKAAMVQVDVTHLEFMNSSCFKCFVSWLTTILEMPTDEQYRVHFLSNPKTLWQRRSLHALRSFALMIVTVEEIT